MSVSIYDMTVPVFTRMLNNLLTWLDKAEADAAARKYSTDALVNDRLAPDMIPLRGQIMIATQYVVRGDYERAQQWLGLQPGQSITVADLQKDLEQFSEVINGDPDGTDLRHSYESGRTVGKKLVEIVSGKYLNVPPLQPPLPGTPGAPNAAPPPPR